MPDEPLVHNCSVAGEEAVLVALLATAVPLEVPVGRLLGQLTTWGHWCSSCNAAWHGDSHIVPPQQPVMVKDLTEEFGMEPGNVRKVVRSLGFRAGSKPYR